MAEITINRDITGANEATIRESWIRDTTTISNDSEKDAGSAVAKLAKKFPDSSAIAADLLLCDYVKVRKVRIGQKRLKKTKVDKKLQKWRKGWVVITTKELLRCEVEFHKDEECWLTSSKSSKKITISELMMDIVTVERTHSSYKSHVMSIVFNDYGLLLKFKSKTTMESWITKLNYIREYFLVQLITSSNEAIQPATYLIHVQAKRMVGYNAIGSQEVAWTWNSTDFYGYRLENKTIPEVEIIIGTQSAAHGNFHFIGPGLVMMCHSMKGKVLALNDDSKEVKSTKADDRFKDSAYVGLGGATSTDGEPKACEDLSDVMQINPSYGIIPRTPECKDEKAKTETTKNKAIVEEYEYIAVLPASTNSNMFN